MKFAYHRVILIAILHYDTPSLNICHGLFLLIT